MRVKKFTLGGHDFKVKYVKILIGDQGELFGRANAKTNLVEVATHMHGEALSEDVIFHTLCHELSHLFMILMYEQELNQNEQFIDQLGLLMHQFLKTKK